MIQHQQIYKGKNLQPRIGYKIVIIRVKSYSIEGDFK